MTLANKEDLKIGGLALLTIVVVFGFIAITDWAGLDWKKWLSFVIWTTVVFGYLGFKYADDLKKLRCLLVFVVLLLVYTTVWGLILLSDISVPDYFYMVISPFEAGIGAAMLVFVGGARGKKQPRKTHADKM